MKSFLQVFSFVFFPLACFCQEMFLSQPYSTPLQLNPGYAGTEGCSRAILSLRAQNTGQTYFYQRAHLSYDQHVPVLRAGVGLNFNQYYEGDEQRRTTEIGYVHSQHFQIGRSFNIRPAFEILYRHRSLDNRFPGYRDVNVIDLNLGFLVYARHIHGGLALYRIGFPRESHHQDLVPRNPREMAVRGHLAVNFGPEDESFAVTPTMMFFDEQDFQIFMVGLTFSYKNFSFGANYSDIEAFILQARVAYKEFRIGYSYDIGIERFYQLNHRAHEVVLSYRFNCKNKRGTFIHPFKVAI
jgi:type IX secretion system PorP/SprF family membrane protein